MKITYYGHACVGVATETTNLLFDPFISPNEQAKHIDVNAVPADYILLSHGLATHAGHSCSRLQQRPRATCP